MYEIRKVKPNKLGEKDLSGCAEADYSTPEAKGGLDERGGKTFEDVVYGSFEITEPDQYYEARWSEYNNHGHSPEKSLFFSSN